MNSVTKPIPRKKRTTQDKSDKLVKLYRSLGFVYPGNACYKSTGQNVINLAPVSFLPQVEYSISSIIKG